MCCYKLSPSCIPIFPPADRIWHSQSFNVGTAGAKIFSGPAVEEFGYTVQQATNHEGKWYEFKSCLNHLMILSNRKRVISLVSNCCANIYNPKDKVDISRLPKLLVQYFLNL